MAKEEQNREEVEKLENQQTPAEASDNAEDQEEQPFWLKDDEEEPDSSGGDDDGGDDDDDDDDDSDPEKDVPVKTHVKVKKKLKGKLKDAESELEQLRKENEQLKQGKPSGGQQQQPQQLKPPKRPRRSEFDDDDAYEVAMDTYEEQRRKYDAQVITYTSQQSQQQRQRQQQVEQAVDQHYDRAEKLVNKFGIKPEVYQQADGNVKRLLQQALPQLDPEMVFNNMVEMVGEGSEAAMFRIGKHKPTGEEFARLLQQDPTGLKASIYLGRIAERISNSNNSKRTSQAPAPAAQARGDNVTNLKAGTARKKWQEAHQKGRAQEAYNLKKAAKAQGIDTSTWK